MTIQSIRTFHYLSLFYFSFFFITTSCTSDKSAYARLENYYQSNALLHKSMSDSLIAFCNGNYTEVILRKSHFKESAISFQIKFGVESTFYPVVFDSALKRHDPYPEKTLKYNIPFNIIENFNKSIYSAVLANQTQTFFGDRWHEKFQLGTQGDSQYGILITSGPGISNDLSYDCEKSLAPNVCLTKGTIP
jgi:hypothetical protein